MGRASYPHKAFPDITLPGSPGACQQPSLPQLPQPVLSCWGHLWGWLEGAGTARGFTQPLLFIFSQVLFGFAARTLYRRLPGTPRPLF